MTWRDYAAIAVLALGVIGLLSPPLFTMYLNHLCDKYDALTHEEDPQ